jgi:thiamine kinase-like enzyme
MVMALSTDPDWLREVIVRAGFGSAPHTVLKGGLSHRVVRIEDGGIVRILDPAVSEAGLGIPVGQEIENTRRAAETGVGPRVERVLTDPPGLVLEFLSGRTLREDDMRDPARIQRIAEACRRLHSARPFGNAFSPFAKARELLARCERHDLPVPDGYTDRLADLAEIESALAKQPARPVPCHNDLLPANLIDDGHRVRIIDYQLSGMNDPAFELGDIAAEARYTPDLTEKLAAAYFGPEMSESLLARVRLHVIVSNLAWTLWFSVHWGLLAGHAADATFDYGAEAAGKWQRAVADLDSGELGTLLNLARKTR